MDLDFGAQEYIIGIDVTINDFFVYGLHTEACAQVFCGTPHGCVG